MHSFTRHADIRQTDMTKRPGPKVIALTRTQRVIAVVPEYQSGPGWSNAVAWVYVEDSATGKVKCHAVQPEERTGDLQALFAPGAAMVAALRGAVPVKNDDSE